MESIRPQHGKQQWQTSKQLSHSTETWTSEDGMFCIFHAPSCVFTVVSFAKVMTFYGVPCISCSKKFAASPSFAVI